MRLSGFVQLWQKRTLHSRFYHSIACEKNTKVFENIVACMSETESFMRKTSSHPSKLNTWDRLGLLRDEGAFQLLLSPLAGYTTAYGKVVGGAMVTALTRVGGRLAMVVLNEWMHKGGTVFPITLKKQLRAQEIARQNRIPVIYVVDTGGAFLPLQADIFPDKYHGGRSFRNQAVMSSEGIPQVAVVVGPCTAGGAYQPTMSDEAAMVEGTGSLYLAGPPLVKAATGEVVSAEELGGARVHCSISGCVDHFADQEGKALERVRDVMATLDMQYPEGAGPQTELLPGNHSLEDFAGLLPDPDENYYRNFPMKEVLGWLVDEGTLHPFKELYGGSLITAFARLGGRQVGVVANDGAMTTQACLKGAHFVQLCSQRRLPLLFLHNTLDGNEEGSDPSTVKCKASLIAAVATSRVPKISVVVGRSVGTSSYAMCNRSMSPHFLFSWPHAVVGGGDLGAGPDSDLLTAQECSSHLYDDGVIMPDETRQTLSLCLDIACRHWPKPQQATIRF